MSQTQVESVANNVVRTLSSEPPRIQPLSEQQVLDIFPQVTPLARANLASSRQDSNGRHNELFEGYDEEQIRLMDEVCIVTDWNDKPVGSASKKDCHIMTNIYKGLLHRAFSVFLFNDENRLLLQQRADEKITFPGMWTNTCCSHPLAITSELGHDFVSSVEGAKNAAQRKLDHELGISKDYIPIDKFKFLTRIHYVAPSNGPWGEHEIDYILFIRSNPKLNVNPNEVKDTKYVTAEELKEMFKDSSLKFTPWFKLICETYLFKWWTNVDEAEKLFREDEIKRMV